MAYKPKSYRKFLATAVTTAAVVTVAAPAAGAQASFPDVVEGSYYAEAVNALAAQGVINGLPGGTYAPHMNVDRGQFAVILAGALNLELSATPEKVFPDVRTEAYYAAAVEALYNEGIVGGDQFGNFNPTNSIDRASVARMVVEGFGFEQDETVEIPFTDVVAGSWYEGYVNTLYSVGVVRGTTATTFSPQGTVDRAQAAVFVYNAMLKYGGGDDDIIEVSVENVEATVDGTSVTVTADVTGAEEATVTITPDENLTAEELQAHADSLDVTLEELVASLEQEVEVEDDAIEATFADLPAGDHTVTVTAGEESATAEFTIEAEEVVPPVEVEAAAVTPVSTSTFVVTAEDVEEAEVSSSADAETTYTIEATFEGEAWEVVSVEANDDDTFTVVVADLDGKKGTLTLGGVEVEVDFSTAALNAAIAAVKSATAANVIERLQAPVLNVSNVKAEYAAAYHNAIVNEGVFINTRAQIQTNLVNYVNAAFAEDLEEALADVSEALSDYAAAFSNRARTAALNDLDDALVALDEFRDDSFERFTDGAETNRAFVPVGQVSGEVAGFIYAEYLLNAGELELSDIDAAVEYFEGLLEVYTEIEDAIADFEALPSEENSLAVIAAYYKGVDAVAAMPAGFGQDALEVELDEVFEDITEVIDGLLDGLEDDVDGELNITTIKNASDLHEEITTLVDALRNSEDKTAFVNRLNAVAATIADASEGLITAVNDAVDTTALGTAFTAIDLSADADELDLFFEVHGSTKFTSIKQIDDALEVIKDLNALNQALTTREGAIAGVNAFVEEYANESYINLRTNNRSEVAMLFRGLESETTFTSVEEVHTALNEAVTAYTNSLAAINSATSITQTRTALQNSVDLLLEVFEVEDIDALDGETVSIATATAVYEELEAKRADENRSNNFATFAEVVGAFPSNN
ncbi:S-layer homology domain-containing protein [Alkalihalophilus marmarensis]|uniref:SLH domain-containing protein n=1 Tax=Alkalihalophilus marmarensis DSM 21297 TaxID=1188261 RepID=U6SKD4_9BACI|nr:S-layer homology domain-containing protein [Alkalihalophilus marmarensis]ERN52058.1 hypothetical protein A33I_18365 [Alkalihalophilus marmarensis DSM 21297]